MKLLLPSAISFVLSSAIVVSAFGASPSTEVPAGEFHPPTEFAHQLGAFRSPLLFDDGTPVKTPADWARRRAQIRTSWDAVMGAWPALIEEPKLEILSTEQREEFTQHKIRLEISKGRTADGYLLVPPGPGKFPAVFVPYYEPETSIGIGKNPLRDFAYQLTKRGFVSLAIGSPGGDARLPDRGEAACQPLSYLGYIAANAANALAHLPAVDPARLGIVGHSYGGKWAMFGSCLCDRYACAVWSDPGIVWDETMGDVNYWEPWYLGRQEGPSPRAKGIPNAENPRTGAYKTLLENGMDLHELHALMAPRPFLVSGGACDRPSRWVALNHTVAIDELLGFHDRVALTSRAAHPPTEESNAQIYAFFERFLKTKPTP